MRKRILGLLAIGLCLVLIVLYIGRAPRQETLSQPEVSKPAEGCQTNLQKTYVVVRPLREKSQPALPQPLPSQTPHIELTVQGVENVLDTSKSLDAIPSVHWEETKMKEEKQPLIKPRARSKTETERETKAPSIDTESRVKKVVYAGTAREVGKQLLGIDGKQKGTVPLITMDYRRTLGWPGYVSAMLKLGGLFFIYDNRTQRIRAQVDAVHGKITPTGGDSLQGLSPRMREIKSEIAVAGLMEEAQKTLGKSDYSLILLLPLNVDADIIGVIAKGLADHDIDIQTVGHILGEHERSGTRICFHVKQLVRRDGAVEQFDVVLAF